MVRIPIVIGVTGHRDLRKQDIPKLKESVREELQKLKKQCPNSPFILLNSLAAGADLLCAEVALELGITLGCPLPMDACEYIKDFSLEEASLFSLLIQKSDFTFVVPAAEKMTDPLARDYFYRQAGIYIAKHSCVLLALWDGAPAKPGGCGTAETVDFMLRRNYEDDSTACFNAAWGGAVIHIKTAREDCLEDVAPIACLLESKSNSLADTLRKIEFFNADAQKWIAMDSPALAAADILENSGEQANRLHALYQKADGLATFFQKKYLSAIKRLSIVGVGLVLAFLFYDVFEANLFLPIYGVLIASSFGVYIRTRNGEYHQKHLRYRVLAETIRVQFFLSMAGLDKNIGETFTWTQKQDSLWVKTAICGLLVGPPFKTRVTDKEIKSAWIDAQLVYHQQASKRKSRENRMTKNTALLMFVLSLGVFFTIFVVEFLFPHVMLQKITTAAIRSALMMHQGQEIFVRGMFKIALGGISAVTLFLSNYYGKLSLDRKVSDHERMISLYQQAQEQYSRSGVSLECLFWELAREETVENGNWYSYCQDNAPGIVL